MADSEVSRPRLAELVSEAYQTARVADEVYQDAIACAEDEQLKSRWREATRRSEARQRDIWNISVTLGANPDAQTLGTQRVRDMGASLLQFMRLARYSDKPGTRDLVAAQAVLEMQLHQRLLWEAIKLLPLDLDPKASQTLRQAYEQFVRDQQESGVAESFDWARKALTEYGHLPQRAP